LEVRLGWAEICARYSGNSSITCIFQHTKRLDQVGFSRNQAETQLEIIGEMFTHSTATKHDLVTLEGAMKKDLLVLETSWLVK